MSSSATSLESASASTAQPVLLEVCVDSVASALAAERGGAARVELCSGLLDGGLTPSFGLIQSVRRAVSIPVMVLIRPRPGDFCYDEHEMEIMREDIACCRRIGVAGVVSGVLLPSGCVDEARTRELMLAAAGAAGDDSASLAEPPPSPLLFTFHRAFDLTPDLPAALHTLIGMGVSRVLTSGGCNDVIAGQNTLKSLVSQSGGRIAILAGGGVTPENVAALVRETGLREVHASLRSFHWGATTPGARKSGVYMGGEKRNDGLEVEYGMRTADEARIGTVVQLLRAIHPAAAPTAAP